MNLSSTCPTLTFLFHQKMTFLCSAEVALYMRLRRQWLLFLNSLFQLEKKRSFWQKRSSKKFNCSSKWWKRCPRRKRWSARLVQPRHGNVRWRSWCNGGNSLCGNNRVLYFETRKANLSSTKTRLVLFVTICFSCWIRKRLLLPEVQNYHVWVESFSATSNSWLTLNLALCKLMGYPVKTDQNSPVESTTPCKT